MKILYIIMITAIAIFGISKISDKNEVSLDAERLNNRLNEVKEMVKTNSKYNTKIAFFIDMKIKSGKKRFFVYDLVDDKILAEGMVAHGSGSETSIPGNLKFSNEPNSKSTSLGKYSIGSSYLGKFGKAYRLHGLEETNSNAFKRNIVLHQYSAVPLEDQLYYISNSQGCPMVSEVFFKQIEKIIDDSKSNIILDIYY